MIATGDVVPNGANRRDVLRAGPADDVSRYSRSADSCEQQWDNCLGTQSLIGIRPCQAPIGSGLPMSHHGFHKSTPGQTDQASLRPHRVNTIRQQDHGQASSRTDHQGNTREAGVPHGIAIIDSIHVAGPQSVPAQPIFSFAVLPLAGPHQLYVCAGQYSRKRALVVPHHRSGKPAEITRRRENPGVAGDAPHCVCPFIVNNAAQQSTPTRIDLRWNNSLQEGLVRNEHCFAHPKRSENFTLTVFVERDTRNGFHDDAQENVPQIIINTVGAWRVQQVNRENSSQYFVTRSELPAEWLPAGKARCVCEQLKDGYSVLGCLPQLRKKIASPVVQRELFSFHQLHDGGRRRYDFGQRGNIEDGIVRNGASNRIVRLEPEWNICLIGARYQRSHCAREYLVLNGVPQHRKHFRAQPF